MKPLKSSSITGSTRSTDQPTEPTSPAPAPAPATVKHQLSRYESQKRRDWHTFIQYLQHHKPGPLSLAHCSGAHVMEFLRYLDQFGKTKIHVTACPFYGQPCPPGPCGCPLQQAWGSLDALIGRLRAAYEESGGPHDANPFADRAVRIYLRHVRDSQARARGIPYQKKKRRHPAAAGNIAGECSSAESGAGGEEVRRCSSAYE